MLEEESKFFDAHKAEWLEKHSDRVALVRGAKLYGFFDNEDDAVLQGARLFGLSSLLAKRVQEFEDETYMPVMRTADRKAITIHKSLWMIAGVVTVLSFGLLWVPVALWLWIYGPTRQSLIALGVGSLVGVLVGLFVGLALSAVLPNNADKSPPGSR